MIIGCGECYPENKQREELQQDEGGVEGTRDIKDDDEPLMPRTRRRGMAVTGKSKNKGAEVRLGWCILGTTKIPMRLGCCDGQKGRDEAVTSQRLVSHGICSGCF